MPRNPKSGIQKSTTFHFISTDPSSTRNKSQTLQSVRSHVGKWTWQQIRARSTSTESSKFENNDDNSHFDSLQAFTDPLEKANLQSLSTWTVPISTLPLVSSPVASVVLSSPSQSPISSTRETVSPLSEADTDEIEEFPTHHNVRLSFTTLDNQQSTISHLGASNIDPFRTHVASRLSPNVVDRRNAYSLSILWPGLMPSGPDGERHSGYDWFSLSNHDPTVHSALLFGSYSHQLVRYAAKGQGRFGPSDRKMMDIAEVETIDNINKAIRDPSRAISDAVILSVLCLATNKYDDSIHRHKKSSPFQAPLRSLQWLDIYGRLLSNPVHQTGLIQLVSMKGGLENIELPGLAAILSYASILGASRALSRPHLPFIPLYGLHEMTMQDIIHSQPIGTDRRFDPIFVVGFTAEMTEVLQAMRSYTSVIEMHEDGSGFTVKPLICDQRNLIQHCLMSLLPVSQLGAVFAQAHPIYEACRIAAMIFGIGVVFPLPGETAPLSTLTKLLQIELHQHEQHSAWSSPAAIALLLWALMLGGIAADAYERDWFVDEIRKVAMRNGVLDWYDLRDIIRSVLWLNCACDSAGSKLWDEVMQITYLE